jgi:hypothetical protein
MCGIHTTPNQCYASEHPQDISDSSQSSYRKFTHRFGIGVSYAGGDIVFDDMMLSAIYAYTFSPLVEVEANLSLFRSEQKSLSGTSSLLTPFAGSFDFYRMIHIQQLDVGVNVSPFSIPWDKLQVTAGLGLRRFYGFVDGVQWIGSSIDPKIYIDELQPMFFLRLTYQVPLTDELRLGIRTAAYLARMVNYRYLINSLSYPSTVSVDPSIPEFTTGIAFALLGLTLTVAL